MNDYLWDKTGEPDEEVERLEELLGTLRHRRQPLALPAEPSAAPSRTLRPFRWPYAAAAALALAALAGLWFGISNRRDAANSPATLASNTGATETTNPAGMTNVNESPGARVGTSNAPTVALAAPSEVERTGAGVVERERQTPKVTRVRSDGRRHQARAVKSVERNLTARTNATPRRGDTRDAPRAGQQLAVVPTSEQQAAKEQLMFALRLASTKLGDVNRKASGSPAARPPRDEQNKLR